MRHRLMFVNGTEKLGYAIGYKTNTGWTFPIVRLIGRLQPQDIKGADVVNAETGEKLFVLDNLNYNQGCGLFRLTGQLF